MSANCSACGYANPDKTAFCERCGNRLLQTHSATRNEAALIAPTRRIVLGSEEVTIGRVPANKIVINEPQVSRRHAVIRQYGDSYEILDLGSANGTFVNGQRLEANVSHRLYHGDTIHVGSTVLTYVNQETSPSPPMSMALPPVFPLRASPPPRLHDFDYTPPPLGAASPPRLYSYDSMGAPPLLAAAPPPTVFRSRGILLITIPAILVLISVILSLDVRNTTGGHSSPALPMIGFLSVLLFVCQMVLLTIVICVIPTLVSWLMRRGNYAVIVIVESAAFVAAFIGFGLWLFGSAVLGTWILYAAALVLIIEAGSRFVMWRKDITLKRLREGTLNKSIEADAEAIEEMARYEVILYIPVPLGLILGTMIGLILHQTNLQIVELCIQLVLLLAAVVLLYFLVVGFLRMNDPLFRTIPKSSPELVKRGNKGKKVAKAPPRSQDAQDQQYIDLASDVSGLRTIYKYDALHNTILLVAFILIVIKVWLIPLDLIWLVISLLATTLVFSEIPYAIGQYLLHNRILEQYTGGKYVEMAKKLQDYAPILPTWPLLGALLTTSTAGGILYALLLGTLIK